VGISALDYKADLLPEGAPSSRYAQVELSKLCVGGRHRVSILLDASSRIDGSASSVIDVPSW
jgi:hypothetical protein